MKQPLLNQDLNYIQNAPMEITLLDGDMDIIAKLDDEPNDVGGLTSAELKAEFDKAGNTIKTYLNETLIPEILAEDATEKARKEAEGGRVIAEAGRVSAEESRVLAEEGRVTAESGRAADEAARAAAETARRLAENERALAETGRADAEQGRVTAEQGRQTAEANREAQETGYVAQARDAAAESERWAKQAQEIAGGDFVPKSEKGQPGGVASLGTGGKVPAAQLPPYVNPNLLDNWYFGDPVNQRNVTHLDSAGTKFSIDRWHKYDGFTFDLVDNAGNKEVRLTWGYGVPAFYSVYPADFWAQIAGKTVCLSAIANRELQYASFTLPKSLTLNWDTPGLLWDGLFLDIYGQPSNNSCFVRFFTAEEKSWTIKAIKLELGTQQTLAHQEGGEWVLNEIPNFWQELAKCQRYFVKLTGGNYYPCGMYTAKDGIMLIPTPAEMETTPEITNISMDSTLLDSAGVTHGHDTLTFTKLAKDAAGVKIKVSTTDTAAVGPAIVKDLHCELTAEI